jgi:hypothetical protein
VKVKDGGTPQSLSESSKNMDAVVVAAAVADLQVIE